MEAINPTVMNLIIFVLAIYVGYHVCGMSLQHSYTAYGSNECHLCDHYCGAMMAEHSTETTMGQLMGFLAITLASVNVFGGFLVTRRMLEMFKKKEKK